MGNLKIEDLVDEKAIQDIKELDDAITKLKEDYVDACRKLKEGIDLNVDGLSDLERLTGILNDGAKKSEKATEQLNDVAKQREKIISRTTNTISRELAELEKSNKKKRESLKIDDDAYEAASKILGSRKDNLRILAKMEKALSDNKKAQKELNDAVAAGEMTDSEALEKKAEMIDAERRLKEEKKELQKTLALEERMSRSVKGSYEELSQRLETVKRAYKQLTEEEKNAPFGKKMAEEISNLDASLKDMAADMGEFQRNVGNYAIAASDKMSSFLGINEDVGRSLMNLAQNGSEGFAALKTSASSFLKTIGAMLMNPAMLAILGIGGTAAAFKWLYDYNKGIAEATKLTHQFTGASGNMLKNQRNSVQALADTYGKDFQEVLISVNAMSKQFGISFEEAFSYVKDGFVSGADVTGEFLDNLKEYPAYFSEAGLSASQFIAITTQANKAGIYSDKGIDVIKEGNLRIREMTQATRDALDGIGISSVEVMKKLENGELSTFEVMQMVSAKLEEFPESSAAVGTAIADIFGGPGEDAGLQYIKTLKDIDTNLDNVKVKAGKLAELEEAQVEAQIEMQNALAALFDFTGGAFEELVAEAKLFVTDGITKILVGVIKLYNHFVEFYNTSVAFRYVWSGTVALFKSGFDIIGNIFTAFKDVVKTTGKSLKSIFMLDWKGFAEGIAGYSEALHKMVIATAKDVKDNFVEEMGKASNSQIKPLEIPVEYKTDSTTSTTTSTTTQRKKGKGKTGAELAKVAEERKKIIAALKQAELESMDEGYAKEMAKIKENHRKRLAEVKGNSAEENALRATLNAQYAKEETDYMLAYFEERAKLNIANELEYAEEGSERKLELLKAQLELERNAEVDAAEKTGSDKFIIAKKYKAKEKELEENFANEKAQKIQEEYAVESALDNIRMEEKLANLKTEYAEGKITKEEYEAQKAAIEDEYAVMSAEKSKSMLEKVLGIEGLSADQRASIMAKLAKAGIDLENAKADATINAKEREKNADDEATKKRLENLNKVSDALNKANEIGNQIFEAKLSRLDEESERNQADHDAEIERIEQLEETGAISKEEAERRKQAAEKKTKEKEQEIEKERRKIQMKQAIWNKANQLAQTGIATARGIMEAFAQAGPFAGAPLAAMIGALGVIQAATIIATPIPKYAKGTDSHPGGLAMVGDGGKREVVLTPEGFWLTPNTPTLVDLPKGAEVFPDVDMFDEINALQSVRLGGSDMVTPSVVVNNDFRRLEKGQQSLIDAIRRDTKERRRIARDMEFENYMNENL